MLKALEPSVKRPEGKARLGRGFSLNELKEVGITVDQARKLKIPVDERRSSKWQDNIARLKELLPPAKSADDLGKKAVKKQK